MDGGSPSNGIGPSRKPQTSWRLRHVLSLAGLGLCVVLVLAFDIGGPRRRTDLAMYSGLGKDTLGHVKDARPSSRVVDASNRTPAAENLDVEYRHYAKTVVMYTACRSVEDGSCGEQEAFEMCVERVKPVCNEAPQCVGFVMRRPAQHLMWRVFHDRECVGKHLIFTQQGDLYLKMIVDGRRLADDELPTRATVFNSLLRKRKPLKFGWNEQLYFTHIPKNGGIFVEMTLRAKGFGATVMPPPLAEVGCSLPHQPLPMTIERADEFPDPGMEVFAVVRHPYKRVTSQWNWVARRTPEFLPYPRSNENFNAWVVDMLKLAKGPDTHNQSHFGAQRGGLYHQDCHWLPQVEYIFTTDRKRQVVKTLLHFDYLDEELEALLNRYGSSTMAKYSKSSRTQSCFRAENGPYFTNQTLDLLDEYYAEDFDLLGFERLRGNNLLSPERYGFPRKGSFAVLASEKTCVSAVWLNQHSGTALRCGHLVQTRWNCSHAYFTYSIDGSCGCVADTAIDCARTHNQRLEQGVRIFSITGGGQAEDLRCDLLLRAGSTSARRGQPRPRTPPKLR